MFLSEAHIRSATYLGPFLFSTVSMLSQSTSTYIKQSASICGYG